MGDVSERPGPRLAPGPPGCAGSRRVPHRCRARRHRRHRRARARPGRRHRRVRGAARRRSTSSRCWSRRSRRSTAPRSRRSGSSAASPTPASTRSSPPPRSARRRAPPRSASGSSSRSGASSSPSGACCSAATRCSRPPATPPSSEQIDALATGTMASPSVADGDERARRPRGRDPRPAAARCCSSVATGQTFRLRERAQLFALARVADRAWTLLEATEAAGPADESPLPSHR